MPDDSSHAPSSTGGAPTGRLSPHDGKELEMLLAGTKPMAMFSQDGDLLREEVVDDAFDEHVASGALIYRQLFYNDPHYTTHFYALPEEEWRIKAMDAIKRSDPETGEFAGFNRHDYYRMVGFLLGYDKVDVEFFIRRSDELRSNGD